MRFLFHCGCRSSSPRRRSLGASPYRPTVRVRRRTPRIHRGAAGPTAFAASGGATSGRGQRKRDPVGEAPPRHAVLLRTVAPRIPFNPREGPWAEVGSTGELVAEPGCSCPSRASRRRAAGTPGSLRARPGRRRRRAGRGPAGRTAGSGGWRRAAGRRVCWPATQTLQRLWRGPRIPSHGDLHAVGGHHVKLSENVGRAGRVPGDAGLHGDVAMGGQGRREDDPELAGLGAHRLRAMAGEDVPGVDRTCGMAPLRPEDRDAVRCRGTRRGTLRRCR